MVATNQHNYSRLIDHCLAGSIGLALVVCGSSIALPVLAQTADLPPVVVTAPDCGSFGFPVYSSGVFVGCASGGGGFGGGGGGGGGSGGGGGGGSGGSSASTHIPEKAKGSCHDMPELSTPQANVAFKAYWETNLKPQIAPNGKSYVITFTDGSQATYRWTEIISSSFAIHLVLNSCRD